METVEETQEGAVAAPAPEAPAEDAIEFGGFVEEWLEPLGLSANGTIFWKVIILLAMLAIISILVDWIAKRVMLGMIGRISRKTKTDLDDILVRNKVFDHIAHILPALVVEVAIPYVFSDLENPNWVFFGRMIVGVYLVIVVMLMINAIIKSLGEIVGRTRYFKDKPVESYTQLLKIVNYIVAGIMIFSIVFDKSPVVLLSAMGAATAVILLIFRDTILGFVASIQLASNDMVRIGDWVTMDKYGADGTVDEINLATVKVRNFDNTITTIPTYAFISDSFRNWRGMTESAGRRIKRSVQIDLHSIRFLKDEELTDLKKIELVREYIEDRQAEVNAYNRKLQADKTEGINGRNLTNIGIFRAYVDAYVRQNPQINTELTCMVRQLPPTEKGVPIEVYAFSSTKEWVLYEGIMADIFDHLLAAADRFGLKLFQEASGNDVTRLGELMKP